MKHHLREIFFYLVQQISYQVFWRLHRAADNTQWKCRVLQVLHRYAYQK